MKSRIVVLGMIVLVCGGWALPQQEKESKDSGPRLVPCPSTNLHVSAQRLLANRIYSVMPQYPLAAIQEQIQGYIALKVVIDRQGDVTGAELKKGHPLLGSAAVKAVKEWKFKPIPIEDGQTGAEGLVVLTFSLNGASVADTGPLEIVDLLDTEEYLRSLCLPGNVFDENLVHRVQPDYPETAKIAHIQGDVVIRLQVDETGRVSNAAVVSGHPLLAEAALAAVRQWRYRPFLRDNKPHAVSFLVTQRFHM